MGIYSIGLTGAGEQWLHQQAERAGTTPGRMLKKIFRDAAEAERGHPLPERERAFPQLPKLAALSAQVYSLLKLSPRPLSEGDICALTGEPLQEIQKLMSAMRYRVACQEGTERLYSVKPGLRSLGP